MEAGRELDALVAEKVMQEKVVWFEWGVWEQTSHPTMENPDDVPLLLRLCDSLHNIKQCEVPYYSTDIAAAWQVRDKISELHMIFIQNETEGGSTVFIRRKGEDYLLVVKYANTAPLAISLAALELMHEPIPVSQTQ